MEAIGAAGGMAMGVCLPVIERSREEIGDLFFYLRICTHHIGSCACSAVCGLTGKRLKFISKNVKRLIGIRQKYDLPILFKNSIIVRYKRKTYQLCIQVSQEVS